MKMINFIIRLRVLPTDTYTAPGIGGVHSHPWGPPGTVPGTHIRDRPERDPTKIRKLKPVLRTGVGIEKISPSPTFVLPRLWQWCNMGSEGTVLEEI